MKLSELIERLQKLSDETEQDPEVAVAYQESYPLCGELMGACMLDKEGDPVDPDALAEEAKENRVIWLAVGSSIHGMSPYAPRAAFSEAE